MKKLYDRHRGAGLEEADAESFATAEDWTQHLLRTIKSARRATIDCARGRWTLRVDGEMRAQWAERNAPGLGSILRTLFSEQRKALAQLARESKSHSRTGGRMSKEGDDRIGPDGIRGLLAQGVEVDQIAKRTGYTKDYIRGIRRAMRV